MIFKSFLILKIWIKRDAIIIIIIYLSFYFDRVALSVIKTARPRGPVST